MWYQAFVQLLVWLFTASTYSCLFCIDWIWNIISIYMNIFHSYISSDSKNEKKLMSEKQLVLKISSTYSKTSLADILIQTKLLIIMIQQII